MFQAELLNMLRELKKELRKVVEQVVAELLVNRHRHEPDKFLTTEELCKEWNISTRTLARYRSRLEYHNPLPYYQFGKQASYKWADCLKFADDNLRVS